MSRSAAPFTHRTHSPLPSPKHPQSTVSRQKPNPPSQRQVTLDKTENDENKEKSHRQAAAASRGLSSRLTLHRQHARTLTTPTSLLLSFRNFRHLRPHNKTTTTATNGSGFEDDDERKRKRRARRRPSRRRGSACAAERRGSAARESPACLLSRRASPPRNPGVQKWGGGKVGGQRQRDRDTEKREGREKRQSARARRDRNIPRRGSPAVTTCSCDLRLPLLLLLLLLYIRCPAPRCGALRYPRCRACASRAQN